MRVTGLGHASALIETANGSILTDPWVNPAYFGSWFPFSPVGFRDHGSRGAGRS